MELIHADFKPDNILVNDKKTSVQLADLGSVIPYTDVLNGFRTSELVTGKYSTETSPPVLPRLLRRLTET